MDSRRSNETRWPNNTLLAYTLPADGQGEGERGRWGKVEAYNSPYKYIAPQVRAQYSILMSMAEFEWDPEKDRANQVKHGVPFELAQYAFADPGRVILEDLGHSADETRYYCIGRIGEGIVTVRFTYIPGTSQATALRPNCRGIS